jgi:hypothetical protein
MPREYPLPVPVEQTYRDGEQNAEEDLPDDIDAVPLVDDTDLEPLGQREQQ